MTDDVYLAGDSFSQWLRRHPEASRRDAWDAALGYAVQILTPLCEEKCHHDESPVGILWKYTSQRHRPFEQGGRRRP